MPFWRSERPRRPIVPRRRSEEDEVHADLLEYQFEIAAGVSSASGTKQPSRRRTGESAVRGEAAVRPTQPNGLKMTQSRHAVLASFGSALDRHYCIPCCAR